MTKKKQCSHEKEEKHQRRAKSEVNEDVCYMQKKLISSDCSTGLFLPLHRETLGCLLLCERQTAEFTRTHCNTHCNAHDKM